MMRKSLDLEKRRRSLAGRFDWWGVGKRMVWGFVYSGESLKLTVICWLKGCHEDHSGIWMVVKCFVWNCLPKSCFVMGFPGEAKREATGWCRKSYIVVASSARHWKDKLIELSIWFDCIHEKDHYDLIKMSALHQYGWDLKIDPNRLEKLSTTESVDFPVPKWFSWTMRWNRFGWCQISMLRCRVYSDLGAGLGNDYSRSVFCRREIERGDESIENQFATPRRRRFRRILCQYQLNTEHQSTDRDER
jgi:hypothetical protein